MKSAILFFMLIMLSACSVSQVGEKSRKQLRKERLEEKRADREKKKKFKDFTEFQDILNRHPEIVRQVLLMDSARVITRIDTMWDTVRIAPVEYKIEYVKIRDPQAEKLMIDSLLNKLGNKFDPQKEATFRKAMSEVIMYSYPDTSFYFSDSLVEFQAKLQKGKFLVKFNRKQIELPVARQISSNIDVLPPRPSKSEEEIEADFLKDKFWFYAAVLLMILIICLVFWIGKLKAGQKTSS